MFTLYCVFICILFFSISLAMHTIERVPPHNHRHISAEFQMSPVRTPNTITLYPFGEDDWYTVTNFIWCVLFTDATFLLICYFCFHVTFIILGIIKEVELWWTRFIFCFSNQFTFLSFAFSFLGWTWLFWSLPIRFFQHVFHLLTSCLLLMIYSVLIYVQQICHRSLVQLLADQAQSFQYDSLGLYWFLSLQLA